jgi:hypothetical protein
MIHLGGKSDVDQFKSIDDQVAVLRVRRKRIADEMRGLEILMRHRERTPERATRYQELNEDLRKVKITEAEIVFLRNML